MQAELERGRRGLTLMQLWRERQALGLNLTVQPKDNSDHKQAQKPSKAAAASGEQTQWAHLLDPLPRQLDEIAKFAKQSRSDPEVRICRCSTTGTPKHDVLATERVKVPKVEIQAQANSRAQGLRNLVSLTLY